MTNVRKKDIPVCISIQIPSGAAMVGSLYVKAMYRRDGDFDFNSISWNGMDIYQLLINVEPGQQMIEWITAALNNHIDSMDPFELWQMEKYGNVIPIHQMNGRTRFEVFENENDGIAANYFSSHTTQLL